MNFFIQEIRTFTKKTHVGQQNVQNERLNWTDNARYILATVSQYDRKTVDYMDRILINQEVKQMRFKLVADTLVVKMSMEIAEWKWHTLTTDHMAASKTVLMINLTVNVMYPIWK